MLAQARKATTVSGMFGRHRGDAVALADASGHERRSQLRHVMHQRSGVDLDQRAGLPVGDECHLGRAIGPGGQRTLGVVDPGGGEPARPGHGPLGEHRPRCRTAGHVKYSQTEDQKPSRSEMDHRHSSS